MGTKPESVDAQKGTMLDIFGRCLKKKIAQVCTLLKKCMSIKEEFTAKYHPCCNIIKKLTSQSTVATL
jgi:hypothetical protein